MGYDGGFKKIRMKMRNQSDLDKYSRLRNSIYNIIGSDNFYKFEKIYEVIFYNDVYCNYQKPFFICKQCGINKINITPILNRSIPKLLVRYYEGTEEFKKFKETSNIIL